MEEWERSYRNAVNAARTTALNSNGVPRAAVEQMYLLYAQMLRDVDRDFGTGTITEARKERLRNQILARLDRLAGQLQTTFGIQRTNSIEAAVMGHRNGIEAVRITGLSVTANFAQVPEATAEFMLQRRGIWGSKNYQTLIGRGLQQMGGEVDRFLNSAISRGVSAERASQELAGMIARNDPRMLGLINQGRLRKSAIRSALRNAEIDLDTFKKARTTLSDARRIMVTEINTAFREADLLAGYQSPVVGYKRWRVSGRHFGLPSSPDVCSLYYESDLFGQGQGVFPILNLPSTPHPNCGCFQQDIMRPPNEWQQPKPPAQEPPRIQGEAALRTLRSAALRNRQLAEGLRKATDNHLKRQIALANEYNDLAYKWASRVRRAVG